MLATSIFITLVGLAGFSTAGYVLEDDYSTNSFFSMFDFFTETDPTRGYVTFVDQNTAQSGGLINTNNNQVYLGVDYTNVASGPGRESVRLVSKKTYTHGLIILDLAHHPGGVCGTWPAFWTVGPNWPTAGEIDIIEGVNSQAANSMALHTGSGCSATNNGMFSGQVSTSNCDTKASGQPVNAGCAILTSNDESYGVGFNAAQGGVYATEWTSDHISIWFFSRSAIPADMSSASPDPSNWGMPLASYESSTCDIDQAFQDHQIVFDTTFCGVWAGSVWSSDPICGSKAPTCQSFVQNNPSAFQDAYWSVNSLKVFQSSGAAGPSSSGVPAPPFSSQVPTAIVPGPSSLSGVPSVYPSAPSPSEPATSSAFNGGGNGWHTKVYGKYVTLSSATASPDTSTDAPGPGAPFVSPVVAAVAPDGSINEVSVTPTVPSAPAITSSPANQDDENADDNVTYATVSALSNDFFNHRFQHKDRREAPHILSEAELALEPRSVPEAAVTNDVFKRHLAQHRHRPRHHAIQHGGPLRALDTRE